MVNMHVSDFYGEEYFAWEKEVGEFAGWVSQTKFSKYISKDDDVLDFGCGGGYLLKNIICKRKIGVEPNKSAIETAERNGLEMYLSIADVPDECVDVIISDNALVSCQLDIVVYMLYLCRKKSYDKVQSKIN
jgi:SAM-dependent methyltransferase